MKSSSPATAAALGIVLFLSSGTLYAQSGTTSKSVCMAHGSTSPEPIGDREGHTLQAGQATCRIEGGALDGAIMTQYSIWESDKANATIPAGIGVVRKAGGVAIYQVTSGNRTLVMKDGKPVGWTAAGKGVYTSASGSLAAVSGKAFSWTAKNVGFNQFTIDTVLD